MNNKWSVFSDKELNNNDPDSAWLEFGTNKNNSDDSVEGGELADNESGKTKSRSIDN